MRKSDYVWEKVEYNCNNCKVLFSMRKTKMNTGLCTKCRLKIWKENKKDELKLYRKEHYNKNLEKYSEQRKLYYNNNLAKILEYNSQWSKDNKEKTRATSAKYRQANSEACNNRIKIWKSKNRDLLVVYRNNRKSKEGKFTKKDIEKLFLDQKGKCTYCLDDIKNYHIEHKIPLSRGGTNYPENLQLTCKTCNLKKATKTHEEYLKILANLNESILS